MEKNEKISEFTVRRLSSYYRILDDLKQQSVQTVSSARLAELGGITPAQVRKDLSYFGSFGTRGLGYDVEDLKNKLIDILGLNGKRSMSLFGAGSLGRALFYHQGFRDDGFLFTHIFDVDPQRIGQDWLDVTILHVSTAEEELKKNPVEIGVVATPEDAAQGVVDLLADLGVNAVLNFATRSLSTPEGMMLRNVNLAGALDSLSFFLAT